MVSINFHRIFLIFFASILAAASFSVQAEVREYWIAAEKTAWNYAPSGNNQIEVENGMGVWGQTLVYQKYRYIGYADKDFSKPEELVVNAKETFENFVADPNMTWFRDNLKNVKAVMIVPRILKGGFIIGGSGGHGALLARDTKTADWSSPAFYTMGSVSFGLQIGGAADQVILMIMTQKAMDSYLSGSFKLGAD